MVGDGVTMIGGKNKIQRKRNVVIPAVVVSAALQLVLSRRTSSIRSDDGGGFERRTSDSGGSFRASSLFAQLGLGGSRRAIDAPNNSAGI